MKKCADCGFLAVRRPLPNKFEEADELFRESMVSRKGQSRFPECFVMASDLRQEVIELDTEAKRASMIMVLQKDRSDCPEWTPWHQGFSPKEHREMLNSRDLERLEDMRATREDRKWWWGVIGVGIALVIATVAGPIVAALID